MHEMLNKISKSYEKSFRRTFKVNKNENTGKNNLLDADEATLINS